MLQIVSIKIIKKRNQGRDSVLCRSTSVSLSLMFINQELNNHRKITH